MSNTTAVLEPMQITVVGDKSFIPVPWGKAEGVQNHLQHKSIRTTLHLDPAAQDARLEIWPGTDLDAVRTALGEWQG